MLVSEGMPVAAPAPGADGTPAESSSGMHIYWIGPCHVANTFDFACLAAVQCRKRPALLRLELLHWLGLLFFVVLLDLPVQHQTKPLGCLAFNCSHPAFV